MDLHQKLLAKLAAISNEEYAVISNLVKDKYSNKGPLAKDLINSWSYKVDYEGVIPPPNRIKVSIKQNEKASNNSGPFLINFASNTNVTSCL